MHYSGNVLIPIPGLLWTPDSDSNLIPIPIPVKSVMILELIPIPQSESCITVLNSLKTLIMLLSSCQKYFDITDYSTHLLHVAAELKALEKFSCNLFIFDTLCTECWLNLSLW